jgi:hypothetical protein
MLQVMVSLPLHTFLSSTVDTVERPVSGFCGFPAAPLMENPRSPLDGKLGGLHSQSENPGERKTSSTYRLYINYQLDALTIIYS